MLSIKFNTEETGKMMGVWIIVLREKERERKRKERRERGRGDEGEGGRGDGGEGERRDEKEGEAGGGGDRERSNFVSTIVEYATGGGGELTEAHASYT